MQRFFSRHSSIVYSMIEVRHLRTFLTVADTENFTRAAERLGVTQPGVSQQIKELEQAARAALFQRLGTRVRLTPAGERFRQRATIILSRFNHACDALDLPESLQSGHLNVGVIPALNVSWIPQILKKMAEDHPGISLTVNELSTGDVETAVESGEIDVGLGFISSPTPNIRHEKLIRDEMCLVVAADSSELIQKGLRLKEITELKLVMPPVSYLMRHVVDEAFRSASLRPQIAFECSSIDALLATAVQTGFSTILPRVVLRSRTHLNLRGAPILDWKHPFEFGLVWPNSESTPGVAETFGRVVRKIVV